MIDDYKPACAVNKGGNVNIKINYNGAYPNLCSGDLEVVIDGKQWIFPTYSLCSGGSIWFSEEWVEHIEEGDWSIREWPENFPESLKDKVIDIVNAEIPHGCCGGCV